MSPLRKVTETVGVFVGDCGDERIQTEGVRGLGLCALVPDEARSGRPGLFRVTVEYTPQGDSSEVAPC